MLYLISVFCLIDDWFKGKCSRQHRSQPRLSDSEMFTIEVVGEFPGLNTDRWLHIFFRNL
jgi:hypothetical protein